MPTSTASPYLAALRGESPERTPVWIMRQAGRYLPEYRAGARDGPRSIDLCRTPELACEVTLQPIRRYGFDAAILFSDILIPLEPMGAAFDFGDGGPEAGRPVRSDGRHRRPARCPIALRRLGFVAEAIRLIKRNSAAGPR